MRAIKYLELKLIFQMDKQTLFKLMLVEHFRNESLHYVGANYVYYIYCNYVINSMFRAVSAVFYACSNYACMM